MLDEKPGGQPPPAPPPQAHGFDRGYHCALQEVLALLDNLQRIEYSRGAQRGAQRALAHAKERIQILQNIPDTNPHRASSGDSNGTA